MTTLIIMSIIAYLCGSISSAILICHVFQLPDPRLHGSLNPGATNVLRISNKYAAGTVFLFDVLKGTIPVWSAYFLGVQPSYIGFVAIAACLGHMYPIFFNFKGGKAVATALGVMLPMGFGLASLLALTWFTVAKLSKYSSLGAIVTLSLAPLYTFWLKPDYVDAVLMLSALILFRHKGNIVRLLNGTELSLRKKK